MSTAYVPLTPATVTTDSEGSLYSAVYGDIYHARAGAMGQAEHVFLRGNGLPARWRGRRSFTVCETGFGLGLNFLTLWHTWRSDPARSETLHVIALERHPFVPEQVPALCARYVPPLLRDLAAQLSADWPQALPGLHRLEFDGGAVTLTLAFGDARLMASRLEARVDAFFLDGFAADRNPEMWSLPLLRELAALAAADATLATWACTGELRGTLALVGFEVKRERGYAGKWHMTIGTAIKEGARAARVQARQPGQVVVIGAGLAGAGVAQALVGRGWAVTVLDASLASGTLVHAGHGAAALTPLVARDDNVRARLSRAGSARAWARWRGLPSGAAPVVCGTVQLERDEGRAAALADTVATLAFPSTWVQAVDQEQARALTGLPVIRGGAYFSQGMLVRPPHLIDALLALPGVTVRPAQVHRVARIGAAWHVFDHEGGVLAVADTVVLANAAEAREVLLASNLLMPHLPQMAQMYRLAGEITCLPSAMLNGGPRCIVGGDGYLLPAVEGMCVVGSTYVEAAQVAATSATGQETNLAKAASLFGRVPDAFATASPGALPGWAGWRALLHNRLPVVGQLSHAPGLWLATGYASRGLSWSALMADLIAAKLMGEPLPIETDLAALVAPR